MDLQDAQQWLLHVADEAIVTFQKVPGSAVLVRYVKSSYQNDPIRSAIELEIEEMIEEWIPEPLVPSQTALEEAEAERQPVLIGPTGPRSKLANGRNVINLASYNFYNFNANEQIKEKAVQTLRTYGVGPCGPPQFYGTQDVHMKTEADIASYLGTESCIAYAHAFSTISSVIPSFCKRGDVIVADRAANYSIRKGLEVSRSSIRWFDHGDMANLEAAMQRVAREQVRMKPTRRFVVIEGLCEATGDCIDLPRLIELKERYKFRIILDETLSFGVLGRTGRGLTEAQNVDPSQVDMIIGSLAGPLCASGGFCAGTKNVVEHQRIMSNAYTFSAALPAMSAVTASETLNLLQSNPEILAHCRDNIRAMRGQLDPRSDWVSCISVPENPIMLLVLKPDVVKTRNLRSHDQECLLQECVDEALANGVLIARLKTYPTKESKWEGQPALKVCITSGLSRKEIEKAGVVIRHAITKVMTRKLSSKLTLAGTQ